MAIRASHVDFLYHMRKKLVEKEASDLHGAVLWRRQPDPTPPQSEPRSCGEHSARAYRWPKCRRANDIPELGIQILQLPNTPCSRPQLSILHLDRDTERRAVGKKKAGALSTSNSPHYIKVSDSGCPFLRGRSCLACGSVNTEALAQTWVKGYFRKGGKNILASIA